MIASQSLSRKAYSVSCSLLNVATGEAFYRKSIMEHLRFKNIDDVKVVPVETTQISCQCFVTLEHLSCFALLIFIAINIITEIYEMTHVIFSSVKLKFFNKTCTAFLIS